MQKVKKQIKVMNTILWLINVIEHKLFSKVLFHVASLDELGPIKLSPGELGMRWNSIQIQFFDN